MARGQSDPSAWSIHPDFVFRQWTANEGFPVSGVTGMYQDDDGFLWVTSLGGLVRFDGRSVTLFDKSSHPDLPSNRLISISRLEGFGYLLFTESREVILFDGRAFTDLSRKFGFTSATGYVRTSNGNAWIFTDRGTLDLAPGGTGVLRTDLPRDAYGGFLAEDGTLWIASPDGLIAWSDTGMIARYTEEDGLPDRDILGLQPSGSALYLLTQNGVARKQGDRITVLYHADAPGTAVDSWSALEREGQMVFTTSRGWRRLDATGLVPLFPQAAPPPYGPGAYRTAPVMDSRGDLWHAIDGNVYRNDHLVLASGGTINQLQANRSGGIWVAHNRLGLFLIRSSAVTTLGIPEGLPGENAYALMEDADGGLWAGLLDASAFVRVVEGRVTDRIPAPTPWSAGRDPDGTVWLGGSGLCRMEASACIPENPPGMDPAVRAIYFDSRNRLWIGTQSGLWVRGELDDAFRRVPVAEEGNVWVRYIAETPEGTLLFGTFGQGLGRLRSDSLVFSDEASGFPSNNIRSILPFASGDVWVGSEDVGLIVITSGGEAVIGMNKGLPDNSVHALVRDREGMIWINSNQGIYRLDPDDVHAVVRGDEQDVSATLIDDAAGMRSREGNGGIQSAGFLGSDGRIHFPTQRGVAIIDPTLVEHPVPPRVTLLSITANGQPLDNPDGRVALEADQRSLSIQFSAPYFTGSEEVSYRYRFSDGSQDWQLLGTDPLLPLSNVPPGTQRLDLQAGISGRWSTEVTSLWIDREAAFTESFWFILVLLGLGTSSGILLVWGRIELIKRRNVQLEQQVQERTETIAHQALRLTELDELKRRFFSNISHELRTPLTLIKGPVSHLLDRARSGADDELQRQLVVVDRNVDRLTSLVSEILDLTALESGSFQLNARMNDITAFVQQIAAIYGAAAIEKGVSLDVETPSEAIYWTFDRPRMEHVLVNLIGNALKFTPSGGRIRVRLGEPTEREIELTVEDTGRGIPESDLPDIFERFFRGQNQEEAKGSGIGLSLCREVVEMHGGRIRVESRVGVGSTFSITLPAVSSHDSPGPASGTAAHDANSESGADTPADPAQERPTLLVAEDHADLRDFLAASLVQDYNVLRASDGREALAVCQEVIPDLVITDVMMPEMSGTELCTALKSTLSTSHIPVIMLTARTDIESRSHGLELGADVYLTKPFETRELHAYVDSLLQNRRRLQKALLGPPADDEYDASLSRLDREFLDSTLQAIAASLDDPGFNVEDLAAEMNLSTRQFRRKLEAITGTTPADLVRQKRMDEAVRLLHEGLKSLKEIGYAVGFKSESGFRKAFKDQYGVPPSQWQEVV
jgi:signal transduction histidine kinase/DNA-binding response OmpR family regulator/ligand-binding sensor domain-containing protein